MENKRLKIGVLGLGLIGGSILKSLHSLGKFHLTAVSKSSFEKAKEYSDVSSDDINSLKNLDIVFVCSKMKDTKANFEKLNSVLDKNTIVTDVCSIKGFLKGEYNFQYIPGHPMAGIEFSGFENSFRELFVGANWVLGKENKELVEIIRLMGAKPVILSSDEHDNYAAQISHLPQLLSLALFNSTEDNALKIAASGFRDMTRLSMCDSDLAYDMLNLNRENLLGAYKNLISEFDRLVNMSEEEFKLTVKSVAQKRNKMYDKNGKNIL